jgi:hypothetical protein
LQLKNPVVSPFVKPLLSHGVYPHVGPYTPYFGFGYKGIGSVPTIWPPMSDPLINPMALPKPISKIT